MHHNSNAACNGRTGGTFDDFQTLDPWRVASRAPRCSFARGAGRRQHRDRRHDRADDRPFGLDRQQERAAAELYIQQHGDTVAGKKIALVVKDDTGAADVTKRLAEELIGNDHASVLMGFGLTPLALAAAPVATEAKVPEIVTAAATAMITEKSPYIVRTSFTLPQAAAPMADWAMKNGIKKVVTIVTDYGPGVDAEKWFGDTFEKAGGTIAEKIRVPLKNPDFAPFLQRVKDDAPDAVFVFVPSGSARFS